MHQIAPGNRRVRSGPRPGRGVRGGFTFIELLIVLMVLGIVATIVVPRVGTALDPVTVNAAATLIGRDLQVAFSEAFKNRRPVRLAINAGAKTITATDRPTGAVIFTRYFGSTGAEFKVSTFTTDRATIDVFPNGLASNPLTMSVGIGPNRRQIAMSRAGSVRITTL